MTVSKPRHTRRLFWDIETSPNVVFSWNIGNKISLGHDNILNERAIICIAWKWEGEAQGSSLHWSKSQNDRTMLKKFLKVAAQADEMVAHNGDRFDVKWVRTRALLHGIKALKDIKTVDTLSIARRKFRFNNARLDYIAKFLGVGGKTSTGFSLWKRVVLDKDPEALKQMVAYCENDVLVLEKVYQKLVLLDKPATNAAVVEGNPAWGCPRCGSTNVKKSKTRITAAGAIQHQMICKDCGEYYTIGNVAFRKYEKARGK
jgi:DNA polymerase elongation subunit (family B)